MNLENRDAPRTVRTAAALLQENPRMKTGDYAAKLARLYFEQVKGPEYFDGLPDGAGTMTGPEYLETAAALLETCPNTAPAAADLLQACAHFIARCHRTGPRPPAPAPAAPVETPPADLLPVETAPADPAPEKDPAPGVPVARRRRYKRNVAPAMDKSGPAAAAAAGYNDGRKKRRPAAPAPSENAPDPDLHKIPVDDLLQHAAAAARKDAAAAASWTAARAAWYAAPGPAPHEPRPVETPPETAPDGPETAPAAPVDLLTAPAPEKPCKGRKRPGKRKAAPAPEKDPDPAPVETAPAPAAAPDPAPAGDNSEQIAFC